MKRNCLIIAAICFVISMIFLLLILQSCAYAEEMNDSKIVACGLGEARSEGLEGLTAVFEAIRNRGTLNGVYGCNAKFNEPQWVWDMGWKAWMESENSNLVDGATHWESTDFKVPYWAKNMIVTAHIGKHIFYKSHE